MKAKNLCVYAGLCAGVASVAVGQQSLNQTPQLLSAGQQVEPIQIAKVAMKDGKVVFQSDWMPYNGNSGRIDGVRIFDCFGDVDSDRFMDDSGGCGLSSSRWYFGSGFSNLFVTNDMNLVSDADAAAGSHSVDFAWFWTAGGSGTSETCVIAIFTQDSQPCDDDSFDYSGWLLDFGTLPSGVGGGYYYTNVDISSAGSWTLPTGGVGSYVIVYAQEVTTSGAFVMATAAQPMLWGTGDAGGATDMVGSQGVEQFDEEIVDLVHTSSECFSYSFSSICPTVLGAMMQFWGVRDGGNECYADFNGDGTVNTQDFLAYLGAWAAGDMSADCNDDGVVNTQDFLCFLGLWAAGC